MIYLSGVTNDTIQAALIKAGVGLMCNPGNSYHLRIPDFPYWAADLVGMGNKRTDDEALDWLAQRTPERCLFITSPDAYPDPVESLRRGLAVAPLIRDMGYPVAVVAQDGAENLTWPWDEMDCLFLGGEKREPAHTEWKESPEAERLTKQARNAGKWVHMGRVNTWDRLLRAFTMGCNSVDGTGLAYGPDRNAPHLVRWLRVINYQPVLWRWETPSLPIHREVAS